MAALLFGTILIFSGSGRVSIFQPALSGQVLGASEAASEAHEPSGLVSAEAAEPDIASVWPIIAPAVPPPDLTARSAFLFDPLSASGFYEHSADERRPIASLTKLMTALVFLDHNPGWDAVYEIKPSDITTGGRTHVYIGEKVFIRDLFSLSLAASDNTAARALVGASGFETGEFIAAMNDKAAALGLENTVFADPVGLHNGNLSVAREIARLLEAAMADDRVRAASLLKRYEFKTVTGRFVLAYSTDSLLGDFPANGISLSGGKTGFTDAAGYCFAGEFTDLSGRRLISVVLGASDRRASFDDTRDLVEWAYENYR